MSNRRVLAGGLLVSALVAPRADAQSALTYQQAVTIARERAPRVAVARSRVDEARGRLSGAQLRFINNPVFDVASGPRWLGTATVTDFDVGISQVRDGFSARQPRSSASDHRPRTRWA